MMEIVTAASLLLALLNPFLVIVYLLDAVEKLDSATFSRVLIRAGLIATVVFCCFAIGGDAIFTYLVQAEFASFQLFGGIVFLLIGIQFVFRGPNAIEMLRGDSEHLAGAIAMPILIGPGTLSASVLVGRSLPPLSACAAIALVVGISMIVMMLLKLLYDLVRQAHEKLVRRYIEIVGRVTALYVGTVAIEMIMKGLQVWIRKFE